MRCLDRLHPQLLRGGGYRPARTPRSDDRRAPDRAAARARRRGRQRAAVARPGRAPRAPAAAAARTSVRRSRPRRSLLHGQRPGVGAGEQVRGTKAQPGKDTAAGAARTPSSGSCSAHSASTSSSTDAGSGARRTGTGEERALLGALELSSACPPPSRHQRAQELDIDIQGSLAALERWTPRPTWAERPIESTRQCALRPRPTRAPPSRWCCGRRRD